MLTIMQQVFTGLNRIRINGTDFEECYEQLKHVIKHAREERGPCLVQAKLSLLNHHTSGVRKEFYRTAEDLEKHAIEDPGPKLKKRLAHIGITENELLAIETAAAEKVAADFAMACNAAEPDPASVEDFVFAPTLITTEKGIRKPAGAEPIMMVDAALFAIREIMEAHPEALLYGQDAGRRLGGVFRETATLAERFGDHPRF